MSHWLKEEYQHIQASPLFRTLNITDSNQPETTINGKSKILAASNNY